MSMVLMAVLAATLIGPLDQTTVTPEWLERNLTSPDVVLVEVGWASTADRPHIPGSRFLPIESIVTRSGWPPDELPPVDELRSALGKAGIGDDGRIILYSTQPLHATRAWFTLDYLGQGDRTAILDGGLERWMAEKRPVATHRFPRTSKKFTAYPDRSRVISLAGVRDAAASGAVLIDARSEKEFNGSWRGGSVTRRGHIPDAHCDPWQANLTGDGSFRPADELKAAYAKIVQKPDTRVIVYCRTGMEATMPYFILRSLGYDVMLYDGSYSEWSRDAATPIEQTTARR